eukprot:scaffold4.g4780.t1
MAAHTRRLQALNRHLQGQPQEEDVEQQQTSAPEAVRPVPGGGPGTLTAVDNRTGRSYEIPIDDHGTIKATDLKQIKAGGDGVGLRPYDNGYVNTTACRSAVSYIDGDKGILRYRGYPIEQLAEQSSFLEARPAALAGRGRGGAAARGGLGLALRGARDQARSARPRRPRRADSSPRACWAPAPTPCLLAPCPPRPPQTAYLIVYGNLPTAQQLARWEEAVMRHSALPVAVEATIAALPHDAHPMGTILTGLCALSTCHPEQNPAYVGQHIYKSKEVQDKQIVRLIGKIPTLAALAYHRASGRKPAPRNQKLGYAERRRPAPLARPTTGPAGPSLSLSPDPRVYKNYDPRARIIRQVAEEVFAIAGRDPLIDVAMALEAAARSDDYFVSRKLYPNVDFYSGLVYRAMGFPPQFFTVLFAVPRITGYLAHWRETLADPDTKIDYRGVWLRQYQPLAGRRPGSPAGAPGDAGEEDEDALGPVPPSNAYVRRTSGSGWR